MIGGRLVTRLAFQLRLAARDLRRHPGLSLAIFVGLSLSGAIWTTANCHYIRVRRELPDLGPSLHHVELDHRRGVARPREGPWDGMGGLAARLRVTAAEHAVLSGSGIPSRQAATGRARLLVAGGDQPLARPVSARFAGGDFFALFAPELAEGRPFSADEDGRGEAVVVLGKRLRRQLFGDGPAVDSQLLVEGRPFRVLGVMAHHQPFGAVWDLADRGAPQDAFYLPMVWARRLLARPEHPLAQGPVGASFLDLERSPTLTISHWVELPDQQRRQAYAAHLDRHFGAGAQARHHLRSYPQWRTTFVAPFIDIDFYTMLTGIVLLAAGFNATRLLLARGFAQAPEVGIHRALGATRLQVFGRELLAAVLLSLPAALLGVVLAVPYVELFNVMVEANDIPVRLDLRGFVQGFFPAAAVGIAAAIYPGWRLSRAIPSARVMRRA
jgi:putative ABC transport system permease protein